MKVRRRQPGESGYLLVSALMIGGVGRHPGDDIERGDAGDSGSGGDGEGQAECAVRDTGGGWKPPGARRSGYPNHCAGGYS